MRLLQIQFICKQILYIALILSEKTIKVNTSFIMGLRPHSLIANRNNLSEPIQIKYSQNIYRTV